MTCSSCLISKDKPSVLAPKNSDYAEKEYWEDRYTKEDSFEWFQSFNQLEPIFNEFLLNHQSIMQLGWGNSTLSLIQI